MLDGHPSEAFDMVTIDNLDFIHSFARIYSGKLQLSWHGTTIQIVIPRPSDTPHTNVLQSKRTLSGRSPSTKQSEDMRSPVKKKERRSRTAAEHSRRNILPQLAVVAGITPIVSGINRTRVP